jgi:hypothetical protein
LKSAATATVEDVVLATYDSTNETDAFDCRTGKYTTFDVPPPGEGLVTVIFPVAFTATSAAKIADVSCDPLTNVVALGLPFQFTTELDTNPVPFTVNVNPAPPGATAVGTRGWLISGTGFDWDNKNVVVKHRNRQTKLVRFIGSFSRIWYWVKKAQFGHRLGEGVCGSRGLRTVLPCKPAGN